MSLILCPAEGAGASPAGARPAARISVYSPENLSNSALSMARFLLSCGYGAGEHNLLKALSCSGYRLIDAGSERNRGTTLRSLTDTIATIKLAGGGLMIAGAIHKELYPRFQGASPLPHSSSSSRLSSSESMGFQNFVCRKALN